MHHSLAHWGRTPACRIAARRDIALQAAQTETVTTAAPAAAAPAAAPAAGAAFSYTSFEGNAFRVQFPKSGKHEQSLLFPGSGLP